MKIKQTLCLLIKDEQILLGMKKRGFGAGNWNGFGGKVHVGETIEAAARREMLEEAMIEVGSLEKIGVLEFEFIGKEDSMEVHIFRAESFSGEPSETEEMEPRWFALSEIPYAKMWPDDVFWLPLLLRGEKFRGKFSFDPQNRIIDWHLKKA